MKILYLFKNRKKKEDAQNHQKITSKLNNLLQTHGQYLHEGMTPLNGLDFLIDKALLQHRNHSNRNVNTEQLFGEMKIEMNRIKALYAFLHYSSMEETEYFANKYRSQHLLNDLNTLVEVALQSINLRFGNERIKLHIKYYSRCNITVNKMEVIYSITNIILNAFEAINNFGIIEIKTKCIFDSNRNKKAQVDIINNGSSIPVDIQESIFDRGFTTKVNGNDFKGHGLTVAKEFIEDNNGMITFQSPYKMNESDNDNSGAMFRISFPI